MTDKAKTLAGILPSFPSEGPPLPRFLGIRWPIPEQSAQTTRRPGELWIEELAPKRIIHLPDEARLVSEVYEKKKREAGITTLYYE